MRTLNLFALLAGFSLLTAYAGAIPESPLCKDSGSSLVSSNGTPNLQFQDPQNAGQPQTFQLAVDIHCDSNLKPVGELTLTGLPGDFRIVATTFPMLHLTRGTYPTAYLSGSCTIEGQTGASKDCRYWLMLTDKTVGFSISRQSGERLSGGVRSVVGSSGEIKVAPIAD